jgi:hypothetical protein
MRQLSSRDTGAVTLRLVGRSGKAVPLRTRRDSAFARSITEPRRSRWGLDRRGLRLVLRAPKESGPASDWRTIAGGIGGALTTQLDEEYPPACA